MQAETSILIYAGPFQPLHMTEWGLGRALVNKEGGENGKHANQVSQEKPNMSKLLMVHG